MALEHENQQINKVYFKIILPMIWNCLDNILFLDIETVPEAADYNELDSEMKSLGA
jgi:hypothetical protein